MIVIVKSVIIMDPTLAMSNFPGLICLLGLCRIALSGYMRHMA
jgi:hypothetical protein